MMCERCGRCGRMRSLAQLDRLVNQETGRPTFACKPRVLDQTGEQCPRIEDEQPTSDHFVHGR